MRHSFKPSEEDLLADKVNAHKVRDNSLAGARNRAKQRRWYLRHQDTAATGTRHTGATRGPSVEACPVARQVQPLEA